MTDVTDTRTERAVPVHVLEELLDRATEAIERTTAVAMQMAGSIGCAHSEGADSSDKGELYDWIATLGDAHWRLHDLHGRLNDQITGRLTKRQQ